MALLVIAVLAALLVAWLLSANRRARYRRDRLRRRPFPAAWRRIVRRRVPAFRRLPEELQEQLKGHIQVFLAEKDFIGCDGMEVTSVCRRRMKGRVDGLTRRSSRVGSVHSVR